MDRLSMNRRDLLKISATGLTAVAAGTPLLPGSTAANAQQAAAPAGQERRRSANERIVVGFIGTGDLGRRHHLNNICLHPDNPVSKRVDVAAVCDVDRNHRDEAAQMCLRRAGRRVGVYEDYRRLLDRKDIDAVFIVTTDHWHAPCSIAAMEAGKDIYCEKPLTLTIEEGQKMVEAARRYGTVFQTGSQQRSNRNFRHACELVRNGKLGRIRRIDTILHAVGHGDWQPPQTPPEHLNWDFWLGPAPYVNYAPNRVHYQFRWYFDYSGGVMTDWGAHHNDLAQWALGMDGAGPVEVDGREARFSDRGPNTAAMNFKCRYRYADGTELVCHTDQVEDADGRFPNGIKFTGENGWIFVSRGDLRASDPNLLNIELGPSDIRLYKSSDHHQNWLDCIATREKCICDVEIGHRSISVCHIGNISMRLGRPLKWDPAKEEFIGDAAANQLRSKPSRAPWHL